MQRFREDFGTRLVRSDVSFYPDGQSEHGEGIRRLLFRLAEDVFCDLRWSELTVYAPTWAQALEWAEQLAKKYGKGKPAEQPSFHLLSVAHGEVHAERVKIRRPALLSESDLTLHYGHDAVEFEGKLIEALRGEVGGATVLRGEPGTGKTTLLRHLIAKLQPTHRFYYLPENATRYLSSPDMVEFWVSETHREPEARKAVILEDAEDLLMQRSGDNRAKVASLLNISDGLLGEFLQIHLICTVNCPVEKLDPAIVRPGRLLACREFKRLSREQAQQLANAKGLKLAVQDDYSLAEIYRQPVIGSLPSTGRALGFGLNP